MKFKLGLLLLTTMLFIACASSASCAPQPEKAKIEVQTPTFVVATQLEVLSYVFVAENSNETFYPVSRVEITPFIKAKAATIEKRCSYDRYQHKRLNIQSINIPSNANPAINSKDLSNIQKRC